MKQLFVKGGAHVGDLSWSVSLTHADNNLIGNGLLPESMLAQRRTQVYTRPDQTLTKMTMVTLNATYDLSSTHQLGHRVRAQLAQFHAQRRPQRRLRSADGHGDRRREPYQDPPARLGPGPAIDAEAGGSN